MHTDLERRMPFHLGSLVDRGETDTSKFQKHQPNSLFIPVPVGGLSNKHGRVGENLLLPLS